MFNVLDRLDRVHKEYPKKYQRIVDRLDEIRRSGATGVQVSDGEDEEGPDTTTENYAYLAKVRKATDDFFSRLATVDRKNEDFWRNVGVQWTGRTELDDLPQNKVPPRPEEEALIRTILLSSHPKDTFKLMLEFNHPQKILHKLMLFHDKRSLLYGVRTKFGLSLGTHLTPKQNFFARASMAGGSTMDIHGKHTHQHHHHHHHQHDEERMFPERASFVDHLVNRAPHVNDFNEDATIKDLLGTSVFHAPDRLLKAESTASERGLHVPRHTSLLQVSSKETELLTAPSSTSHKSTKKHQEAHNVQSEPSRYDDALSTFSQAENPSRVSFEGESEKDGSSSSSSSSSEEENGQGGEEDAADTGGMDQYRLQRLKIIFEESDTDDEPGLDINEFKQAMKKIMGEDVTDREIELTFMKVDANCDGNVDWNEFLEFTLREFQERDLMTQLTKDAFFEKTPMVIPATKSQKEIRALVFVRQQGFGKSAQDLTNGRYYSLNVDGQVVCWTADFKKIAAFELIADTRGVNAYVHANDLVAIPEIKTLVVSFTTGELHFYSYDDTKLDLVFSISCLKSPVLCMHYCFNDAESVLLLGDQMGQVGVIRFRNLQYEGLWGSLALPHSNNPKVPWSVLKARNSAFYLKDIKGTDWINQVKFFPNLNAVVSCSLDPKYALCVIPFHKQRDPVYFAHKEGFNCFDYSDFLNVIVTGSKNRSIQVWNQDNVLTPTGHFDGHEGPVNKVVVYKDADFTVLISADALHVLKVWDFKDQACLQSYDAKTDILPHHSTMVLVYNTLLEHVVLGARDFLVLKRVSRVKKGPVDPVQKTHAQPIVGMLYNELFECVVTSCLESTIMVWNFQTGEKIIQFRNAHTVEENGKTVQIPVKSMCFDANQRRLLTCASDGLVKLWNFNNGACLSFFDHLQDVDLNVVRYQKNRDLVIAAGWNKSVFMVRDTRGEDDIDETVYEWDKHHRSDITALELIYGPDDDDEKNSTSSNEGSSASSNSELNNESTDSIKQANFKDQGSQTMFSVSCDEVNLSAEEQDAIKSFVSIMHSDDDESEVEGKLDELGTEQPFVFNVESETFGSKDRGAGPSFADVGCNTSCGLFSVSDTSSVDLAGVTSSLSTPTGDEEGDGDESSGEGSSGGSDEGSGSGGGDSESSGAEERAKLSDDGSYIVTGCADGELIVWNVFSGEPICFLNTDGCPFALTRQARAEYAASTVVDFPKVEMKDSGSIENFLTLQVLNHQKNIQRQQAFPDHEDLIQVPKIAPQARNCITAILILRNRVFDDGKTASILTSSTDGFIRAWSIEFTSGGIVGLFYAAHEFDSFVTTMCTDEKNELLFTADTRGYIKIWLLCEWMQAPPHLENHRHCIDPRNFPFIKRRKIFAMLIAFRSNYMMKKAVEILPQTQRGLYKQPVILNSFRGHLLRVTQITVVFGKKIIITASEDCSVRLWHFSGLYIGTLGQEAAFRNDSIPTDEIPEKESAESNPPSKTSQSVNLEDSKTSAVEVEVTDFLHEDEDPNEVLLKPKVIIPHDIAEKGSLATLQVLYSDRHKRTIIPAYIEEAEQGSAETESASQTAWFESKEDYMEALGELAVEKNRFEELKTAPVRFYGDPHAAEANQEETNDEETLIFNQQPLQEVEPVGGLETVIPKNLYGYHLHKVQEELLDALPVELRKPYIDLKQAGLLVGPALDELRAVIQHRQQSLARPRMTAMPKNRNMEKRVRMKEVAKSVTAVQKKSKFQKRSGQASQASHINSSYAARGDSVLVNDRKVGSSAGNNLAGRHQSMGRKATQKRHNASGDNRTLATLANIVTAFRSSSKAPGTLPNPTDNYTDDEDEASRKSGVQSMSDKGDIDGSGQARKSTKSSGLKDRGSQESVVDLNQEFLNADRIDIGQLRSSEEEFVEDLMCEQERNAKFDYLALLEGGMARPSQIEQYMPIVQNDGELFTEIKPMLRSRNLFDVRPSRPLRKKITVKSAKSVSSMDRIQRIFRVPDFNGEVQVKDTSKELHLTIPPAPRRLPSVIKGQVRNGQRKSSFYNFHELDEAPSPLGGTKLWGDQESLAIFDLDVQALQTHIKTPAVAEKDSETGTKKKQETADISKALHQKEKVLPKQRPFSNRYIYRQLSDSVVHQPVRSEIHNEELVVDLDVFVESSKGHKEKEEKSHRETKRLNQELHETQRRSWQASKAKTAAKKKQEAKMQGSFSNLSKMLDEVDSVEMEFVQENLPAR